MNPHLDYRPDIDGLRAFAIISVLLFHAFPSALTGGFVGVDVFFVISGYLISSIIFKSCEKGEFSYSDFYIRRIRRIFPALVAVLMSVILLGWLVLLPDEYQQLGKHVLSGAGFVSNLVLWRESGYFDTVAELKPLLHLWSLGVEEQYYILWPVLVALIWKRSHNFLLLVIPVMLVSFGINIWWTTTYPTAAFFLPMARFWELMLGSLLAYIVLHRQQWLERFGGARYSDWFSIFGAFLLLTSFFVLDRDMAFPGWLALLPALGAFFLIYAGKDAWINAHILSNKALVYVGLISYPLYLWHWPVLVLGKLSGLGEFVWGVPALLVLAVVLADLTYRWIEKPIRAKPADTLILVRVLSFAMVVVALVGLSLMYRIPPLHSSAEIQRIVAAVGEWDYPGRMKRVESEGLRLRHQGNTGAPVLLFVGDSNIEQYYPRAEFLLAQKPDSMNLVFATLGGCPPVPHIYESKHPRCKGFAESVMAYVERADVSAVVVGAQWLGYFPSKGGSYYYDKDGEKLPLHVRSAGYLVAMSDLRGMLASFVRAGKKVYLVGNMPIGAEYDPKSLIRRAVGGEQFVSIEMARSTHSDFVGQYRILREDLGKVASDSGAQFIDPVNALCDSQHCLVTQDGVPIYKDANHLRPSYVRYQAKFIDAVFP